MLNKQFLLSMLKTVLLLNIVVETVIHCFSGFCDECNIFKISTFAKKPCIRIFGVPRGARDIMM